MTGTNPNVPDPEVTARREALSKALRLMAADLVVADVGPYVETSRTQIVQALSTFCDLMDAQTRLHRGLRP